jgi:hypothetical protein
MIIEGDEILITSQKITIKNRIPEHKYTIQGTKLTVFPVTLKRHGDGKITRENSCIDSKGNTTHRFDTKAFIIVGESINGRQLYGFASKPIKEYQVGGIAATGNHSCQHTELKGCCLLRVYEDYLGNLDPIHPRELYNKPRQIEANT